MLVWHGQSWCGNGHTCHMAFSTHVCTYITVHIGYIRPWENAEHDCPVNNLPDSWLGSLGRTWACHSTAQASGTAQSTICPTRGWAAWAGLGLATAQPKLVVQRPRGWAQLGHARLGMPKQLIGLATDWSSPSKDWACPIGRAQAYTRACPSAVSRGL